MQDPKRVFKSNLALVLLVLMVLLYGIVYRIRTGDNSLYLFGYKIQNPFTAKQTTEEAETSASAEEAASAVLSAVESEE